MIHNTGSIAKLRVIVITLTVLLGLIFYFMFVVVERDRIDITFLKWHFSLVHFVCSLLLSNEGACTSYPVSSTTSGIVAIGHVIISVIFKVSRLCANLHFIGIILQSRYIILWRSSERMIQCILSPPSRSVPNLTNRFFPLKRQRKLSFWQVHSQRRNSALVSCCLHMKVTFFGKSGYFISRRICNYFSCCQLVLRLISVVAVVAEATVCTWS